MDFKKFIKMFMSGQNCGFLVSRLQPLRPMDSRSFVRSSYSISRKPRIRFWWCFAPSYILMSLKKCSRRIFEKNSCFRDFGQKWPIFAIFSLKIRFLDIFFETVHQICLKIGQKLGTAALNHLMAVLCLGKFLFWPF